jgi:hypothetical protein
MPKNRIDLTRPALRVLNSLSRRTEVDRDDISALRIAAPHCNELPIGQLAEEIIRLALARRKHAD